MKQRRLGMIDVFLIVVLLLSGIGIVLRMHMEQEKGTDAVNSCTVAIFARQAFASGLDCMELGEMLYTEDGTAFGRIVDIVRAPAQIVLYTDGRECVGEWDEQAYCNATLLVEVLGRYDGTLFLQAGRYPIIVGKALNLYSERVHMTWVIQSVKNIS